MGPSTIIYTIDKNSAGDRIPPRGAELPLNYAGKQGIDASSAQYGAHSPPELTEAARKAADLLADIDHPAALEARDLLLAALGESLRKVKPR